MATRRLTTTGKYRPQEDIQEREELDEIKRRTRYASEGVKALAIALHVREWRMFYNVPAVYKAERHAELSAFDPHDFELLPSCD